MNNPQEGSMQLLYSIRGIQSSMTHIDLHIYLIHSLKIKHVLTLTLQPPQKYLQRFKLFLTVIYSTYEYLVYIQSSSKLSDFEVETWKWQLQQAMQKRQQDLVLLMIKAANKVKRYNTCLPSLF